MIAKAGVVFWKVILSGLYGAGLAIMWCPILWINQKSFAFLFNIPGYSGYYKQSVLLRDDNAKSLFWTLRKWNKTITEQRELALKSAGYSWRAFSILSSKHDPSP